MAYKIQELTEQGYDFTALFPQKQESVRASTGLDFDLESIVKFLQKQTNNFSIDNQLAHDLDDAIFALVKKSGDEKKPVPVPEPEEDLSRKKIIEEFESVIDSFELFTEEEQQEQISDFEIEMDAIELLDDEESKIRFTLLHDMLIPKLKELKN